MPPMRQTDEQVGRGCSGALSPSCSSDDHQSVVQDRNSVLADRRNKSVFNCDLRRLSSGWRRAQLSRDHFGEDDSRGSVDFFDEFLPRFLRLSNKKEDRAEESDTSSKATLPGNLKLPPYDSRFCVNFSLLKGRKPVMDETGCYKDYRSALHLFELLRQRQTLEKIKKIRADQMLLPIARHREAIIAAVRRCPVILISGDTGCGKSTQVPQYLLSAGFRSVACTQPRRISCVSLCRRVSMETLNSFGEGVGYQVRFDSQKGAGTAILFLTEGLLLRQLCQDRLLSKYDVVIVDEVHERHVSADILLSLLKGVLQRRRDFRVVLMSATADPSIFTNYFGCPVMEVPGRCYPVAVEYIPCELSNSERKSRRKMGQSLDLRPYMAAFKRIAHSRDPNESGDVLVFLPGVTEIQNLMRKVKEVEEWQQVYVCLPLHSGLDASEQDRCFDVAPPGMRKLILSTNVAETSVTIDGIRFVVDSGRERSMGFSAITGVYCLQDQWISIAGSEQRKGRAGRTGPGVCIRLYDESHYRTLEPFSEAEIRRCSLDGVCLQLLSLGVDPLKFVFLEPPPSASLVTCMRTLHDAGAIVWVRQDGTDGYRCELSPLGAVLSSLPVDPCIGKLLVLGCVLGFPSVALTLSAMLSVGSCFGRKFSGESAFDFSDFATSSGDTQVLLSIFSGWATERCRRGADAARRWCKRKGVKQGRLFEAARLREQFRELLRSAEILDWSKDAVRSSKRTQHVGHQQLKRRLRQRIQEAEASRGTSYLDVSALEDEVDDGNDNPREANVRIDITGESFDLSHDLSRLENELKETPPKGIVQALFVMSFYPNYALPDEHNKAVRESECVFNTKQTKAVAMHPTSIFASRPSSVTATELVSYGTLLETVRPFLVNVVAAPAVAALLLSAKYLDTDPECCLICVDNWLIIEFESGAIGSDALATACGARMRLLAAIHSMCSAGLSAEQNLLPLLLEGSALPPCLLAARKCAEDPSPDPRAMADVIDSFVQRPLRASLRRVPRGELAWRFTKAGVVDRDGTNSEQHEAAADALADAAERGEGCEDGDTYWERMKCGVRALPFLRYASLYGGSRESGLAGFRSTGAGWSQSLRTAYVCEHCKERMMVTPAEARAHAKDCVTSTNQDHNSTCAAPAQRSVRSYYCSICATTLQLSPADILRHRKSHAT